MSGLLGMVGGMLGGGGGADRGALQGVLGEALNHFGGVGGLVGAFEQAGMGEHVRSWIGDGSNLPVSPDQIRQVFSSGMVQGWAQRAGVPPDTMAGLLSQMLPAAVDHVTPGGAVPQAGAQDTGSGGPAGGFSLGGVVGKLFGED